MAPKLTKEEKKARAAEKKAEKKRLAEEKKKQLKVDQLERELKYGKLTIKRHEKSWKDLLLSIGIPEVKKQLEYAWHNFEIAIDAKDFQISLLMDGVKEAEEQYMMNVRSHCENIDRLVLLFKEQLEELNSDNKAEIRNMRMFNEQEVEKLMSKHKEDENFLNMMLYGLEMMQKEQDQFIRCEYCARIEEEQGKNADIIQRLNLEIHDKYSKIWNDTIDFLSEFYQRTNERRKKYEVMHNQEEQVNNLMQIQVERIIQLYEIIRKLKYKRTKLENTVGQKAIDLSMERLFFADSFWSLKMKLEREINLDNSKLAMLTVQANEAMETLKKIETKGAHILQLAAMCRKYETIQEKVLPFPTLGKSIKYTPMNNEYFNDILELKTFWKRIGQANAIRYSMYEEKRFLEMENEKLRKMIHQYCECLNCVAYEMPQKQVSKVPIITIDGDEMKKYSNQNVNSNK